MGDFTCGMDGCDKEMSGLCDDHGEAELRAERDALAARVKELEAMMNSDTAVVLARLRIDLKAEQEATEEQTRYVVEFKALLKAEQAAHADMRKAYEEEVERCVRAEARADRLAASIAKAINENVRQMGKLSVSTILRAALADPAAEAPKEWVQCTNGLTNGVRCLGGCRTEAEHQRYNKRSAP